MGHNNKVNNRNKCSAKNETWAAYSQMCVCEADKTGLNCDEISSAGIGGIVLDTIAVILGFMTFFIALWNTWRLVKKDYVNILKRKQLSVLPSTSLFACLGALFVGLYSLEQVIFHSTPSAEIDSAELKRIHPAQGFMYTSVLAFFFVSLACLVSLQYFNLKLELTFFLKTNIEYNIIVLFLSTRF